MKFWGIIGAMGVFILQIASLGRLGLAIIPICLLWFLAGMNIGDTK